MWRLAILLLATLALAACADPRAAENQRIADAFLAANVRTPGVIRLPSGLEYSVSHNGPAGGLSPRPTDQVLAKARPSRTMAPIHSSCSSPTLSLN